MSPKKLLSVGLVVLLLAAVAGLLVLNRRVDLAIESHPTSERPVEMVLLPERGALPFWGSEDVESLVSLPDGIYAAGSFGVARLQAPGQSTSGLERSDISLALPTRRARALSSWRTDLAAGLENGGLFVWRDGAWSEIRSGFGTLHVRDLAETAAGELWIGAREGLFRMGFAERSIERVHTSPVRALATGEGGRLISGGEQGVFTTQGGVTRGLPMERSETAWVDDVAVFDRRVHAVTPAGLFAEGTDGILRPLPGGENVGSVAVLGDSLYGTGEPPDSGLRRFDASGRLQVEKLPSTLRRVFAVGDRLVADTQKGLMDRSSGAWAVLSPRLQADSFGYAHVGALAAYHGRLMVGFFDGGLAELNDTSDMPMLRAVRDSASSVWAVNALLNAGGVLHVASLRGATRYDGSSLLAVEGAGAAFSLALTTGGVAIGYGEGVLLPERKLLSSFHGLPGNQATALATAGRGLLVGTPSGLGYVEGLTVRWRVASGEGRLPHPWVTAILPLEGAVLVGTYGGGVTRREGALSDKGAWKPFAETEGLKVNTGCLVRAKGRVYVGTDGAGLFRLSVDGSRFERLKLSLPSMRITALFEKDGFLYIGTDEGLTRWSVEEGAGS